jgi:hypothetical protein
VISDKSKPLFSVISHQSSLVTYHSSLITYHSSLITHHFLAPSIFQYRFKGIPNLETRGSSQTAVRGAPSPLGSSRVARAGGYKVAHLNFL